MRTSIRSGLTLALFAATVAGCGGSSTSDLSDGGTGADGGSNPGFDSGLLEGGPIPGVDSSLADAGPIPDSSVPEAGPILDSGLEGSSPGAEAGAESGADTSTGADAGVESGADGSGADGSITGTDSGEGGTDGGSVCGNGTVEMGEGCDDGNMTAGDGCTACQVDTGYSCDNTQSPSKCTDINECASSSPPCSGLGMTCTNTIGGYTCGCKAGYTMNMGACIPGSSCSGMTGTECQGGDCCASLTVPGGTYVRDGVNDEATVATFALDTFEVTVGRFRNFVGAYSGPPVSGAGADPSIANSGWQATWNAMIAANATALASTAKCVAGDPPAVFATFSTTGAHDELPINCVNWYEAFAFCAWDGGWLPSEAEWEYTAMGGASEFDFPWGNTPTLTGEPDSTAAYANYSGLGDGSGMGVLALSFADILEVGSKPLGVGKYGQMDLSGSMGEWVLDYNNVYPSTCDNCADLDNPESLAYRVIRGGSWSDFAADCYSSSRSEASPIAQYDDTGIRCARSVGANP